MADIDDTFLALRRISIDQMISIVINNNNIGHWKYTVEWWETMVFEPHGWTSAEYNKACSLRKKIKI